MVRLQRSNRNGLAQIARYVWAFPATALGLCLVFLALLSGGSVRSVTGVLEVHGGLVTRLLRIGTPWIRSVAALTLGHVVLGLNQKCLEQSRIHERVHVKQYEKWGPLFIPLYLLSGMTAFFRGRDPYWDNAFEKEAYRRL